MDTIQGVTVKKMEVLINMFPKQLQSWDDLHKKASLFFKNDFKDQVTSEQLKQFVEKNMKWRPPGAQQIKMPNFTIPKYGTLSNVYLDSARASLCAKFHDPRSITYDHWELNADGKALIRRFFEHHYEHHNQILRQLRNMKISDQKLKLHEFLVQIEVLPRTDSDKPNYTSLLTQSPLQLPEYEDSESGYYYEDGEESEVPDLNLKGVRVVKNQLYFSTDSKEFNDVFYDTQTPPNIIQAIKNNQQFEKQLIEFLKKHEDEKAWFQKHKIFEFKDDAVIKPWSQSSQSQSQQSQNNNQKEPEKPKQSLKVNIPLQQKKEEKIVSDKYQSVVSKQKEFNNERTALKNELMNEIEKISQKQPDAKTIKISQEKLQKLKNIEDALGVIDGFLQIVGK
ncbi:Hypothetical_protein [Hexamita inflata]|uniref:Hypothetical_protein n=1 Tax=Hexamita inflata TaxID=28002 RepID=A0AA86QV01_9EUKA|nr:Hypothetical protein HINF_LOCUS31273 [Hexamita inflata]CAI9964658.1 Hypothetical protein HINF_LOCUS52303 [Hexamita inflata]